MKYFVKQAIVFTTANEICYFYYYYTISIFICLLFIFIREYVNTADKTCKRLNSLLLSLWTTDRHCLHVWQSDRPSNRAQTPERQTGVPRQHGPSHHEGGREERLVSL